MRSALITGITGQDGGYLTELLVAEGTRVHGCLRHGEQPPQHLLEHGDLVVLHQADLLDDGELAGLMAAADPDEVYNLVGVSSVAQSWADPVLTLQVNGEVVVRLLQHVQQRQAAGRPTSILQASSAEVFAGSGMSPQDESTPIVPRSPYGAAKAYAHHTVRLYRSLDVHAVNVVLYNHESPRRPPTFVTRKITRYAAELALGRASSPLVLGNLEARRDWGWAPEYVDGMVRALRHPEPRDFILATGTTTSVRDFARLALRHAGVEDPDSWVVSDEAYVRPTDAAELVGDARLAQTALGWRAQRGVADVVRAMVDADLAGLRS